MGKITVQALVKDIAELNGLTENQEIELYRDIEQFIDTWFRKQGL